MGGWAGLLAEVTAFFPALKASLIFCPCIGLVQNFAAPLPSILLIPQLLLALTPLQIYAAYEPGPLSREAYNPARSEIEDTNLKRRSTSRHRSSGGIRQLWSPVQLLSKRHISNWSEEMQTWLCRTIWASVQYLQIPKAGCGDGSL